MVRPLCGCERLHRKRVDFFAHAITQRAIDNLVALNARFSGEGGRHDHSLKVRAITLDGEVIALEFIADISLYCLWCDHGTDLDLTEKEMRGWSIERCAMRADSFKKLKP